MNRFLRAAMVRRESMHEERMSAPGSALPKDTPRVTDEADRREKVMALFAEGLSAREIALRLRLTVAQVQRAARS